MVVSLISTFYSPMDDKHLLIFYTLPGSNGCVVNASFCSRMESICSSERAAICWIKLEAACLKVSSWLWGAASVETSDSLQRSRILLFRLPQKHSQMHSQTQILFLSQKLFHSLTLLQSQKRFLSGQLSGSRTLLPYRQRKRTSPEQMIRGPLQHIFSVFLSPYYSPLLDGSVFLGRTVFSLCE